MLWPSTSTLKVLSPYLQYDFSIKIDYCIHLNRSNLLLLHHQHFLQWVDTKVNFWFDLVRSLFLDFYISSTSGCLKSSLYFLHQHQISKQVYAYISLIVPNNHKILNQPKFRSPSYIVSFPTLKYWYYFSFIIITFFYPFWIYDITSHVVDQFWCCLSFALHVNSPNISNPHLMISSMALWLKKWSFFPPQGKETKQPSPQGVFCSTLNVKHTWSNHWHHPNSNLSLHIATQVIYKLAIEDGWCLIIPIPKHIKSCHLCPYIVAKNKTLSMTLCWGVPSTTPWEIASFPISKSSVL